MDFGEWYEGEGVLTGEDFVWIGWEGERARDDVSFGLKVGHLEAMGFN